MKYDARSAVVLRAKRGRAGAPLSPVVLLPGAMSTARDWPTELLDRLSTRRRVYALDLREMGRCQWSAAPDAPAYGDS
jgi:pimeloyl-ACP methyl ester carboxylesterase